MMAAVAGLAEQVRHSRRPATADNPFLALQENVSRQIVTALDSWRDFTEAAAERLFFSVYSSPTLQAAAGIDAATTRALRKAANNPLHDELLAKRIAELKSRIPLGGLREAVVRALLYVGMSRSSVDERAFEMVRRIRRSHGDLPLPAFKVLVREQFNMLLLDREAALAVIPALLPPDAEARRTAFDLIKQVITARGELSDEDNRRMAEVAQLFELDADGSAVPFRQTRKEFQARAS
jgi:hypothetical protein